MRLPFLSMFITSPFAGLQEHAEKVKECAWAFQTAFECYNARDCNTFDELRREVRSLENQADAIKRRIRGHLPKGTLMPVDKFELFRYLREQDNVLDAMDDALDWLSYRPESGIPEKLTKDFFLLVDAVINPVELLVEMVAEARKYFRNYSERQRVKVKDIIRRLRRQEQEADTLEDLIKHKVFSLEQNAIVVFHLTRLAETIGHVADHAENAGDMMRAMVAR